MIHSLLQAVTVVLQIIRRGSLRCIIDTFTHLVILELSVARFRFSIVK